MNIMSHLKQQWLGLLVGALGIGFSVYTYAESRQERDPVFVVDPNRVEIISEERVANSPIVVLRRDKKPIRGDVYTVRFFFWNAGKLAIEPPDILEPLQITLGDSSSEILDYRSVKTSRPITHIELSRARTDSLRTLLVSFSILERGDGLAGQIIYQGRRGVPLQIAGTIKGAAIRTSAAPSIWTTLAEAAGALALIALGAIVIALLFGIVMVKLVGWLRVKERLEQHQRVKAALPVVTSAAFIILVLVGLYYSARQEQATDVVNLVPSKLIR